MPKVSTERMQITTDASLSLPIAMSEMSVWAVVAVNNSASRCTSHAKSKIRQGGCFQIQGLHLHCSVNKICHFKYDTATYYGHTISEPF